MNANESLDFLREKLNAARDRCAIHIDGVTLTSCWTLPTIEHALNVMDPFVTKAWDGSFAAKTPIWSPLFPMWWWEN